MIEFSQAFKDSAEVGLNIILGLAGWSAIIFLVVCLGAGIVYIVNFYRHKPKEKT